jgi:hypothetical protein
LAQDLRNHRTLALYLNVFVFVVQAFLKVPALNALAPKQSEPPFAITQGVVLLGFIVLTILATIRFRVQPVWAARPGASGRFDKPSRRNAMNE